MNSADLVAELRDIYENWGLGSKGPGYLREAADRIEALEAWKAEAMEVLRAIKDVQFPGWEAQTAVDYCRDAARRLVEKEDGRNG